MSKRALVIFLDAVPQMMLEEHAPFLSQFGKSGAMTPGLGFSINLFPMLFAGISPDKLGYFNKWTLSQDLWNGDNQPQVNPVIKSLARIVDRTTRGSQLLSRAIHKGFEKIYRQGNIANIPCEYLPFYVNNSLGEGEVTYFFDEHPDIEVVRFNEFRVPIDKQDECAFDEACKFAREGKSVFITLGYLDHLGHLKGPESDEFKSRIRLLDGWCEQLVDIFSSVSDDDFSVVICSDHGMAPVTERVYLDLDKHFGAPSMKTYAYFLDSVIARIWVKTPTLAEEISEYLTGLGVGLVLDQEQRTKYGTTNKEFGDIIFLLDEGKIFWPGWYGGWFPKGMHGYMPTERAQQAVIVVNQRNGLPEDFQLPKRSIEVYSTIRQLLFAE